MTKRGVVIAVKDRAQMLLADRGVQDFIRPIEIVEVGGESVARGLRDAPLPALAARRGHERLLDGEEQDVPLQRRAELRQLVAERHVHRQARPRHAFRFERRFAQQCVPRFVPHLPQHVVIERPRFARRLSEDAGDRLWHIHLAQAFEQQRQVALVDGTRFVRVDGVRGDRLIEQSAEALIAPWHDLGMERLLRARRRHGVFRRDL